MRDAYQCGRLPVSFNTRAEPTLKRWEVQSNISIAAFIHMPRNQKSTEAFSWCAGKHAGARGVQTRIGMEDTLRLPDGSTAPDNAALVSAAVQLLSR